jgi:hypothetical protein
VPVVLLGAACLAAAAFPITRRIHRSLVIQADEMRAARAAAEQAGA